MKKIALVVLLLVTLMVAASSKAGLVSLLTSHHCDWAFIESVGGMKVELAKDRLDVSCDVSGTQSITTKPTTINSALGVRKLKCSRKGNTIRLSVVTSIVEKGMTSECGSVDVSDFPAGTYAMVYLNPDRTTHPLGMVTLP